MKDQFHKRLIASIQHWGGLLLILGFVLFFTENAQASHIVGGDLSYRCLGGNQYEIRMIIRRDCNNANPEADFDDPAAIFVYDGNGNPVQNVGNGGIILLNLISMDTISSSFDDDCSNIVSSLCIQEAVYIDTITLPRRPGGYNMLYQRCCRNVIINNIVQPLEIGMTLDVRITEEALETCNSSPVFVDFPDPVACIDRTFTFDHAATDADRDSIVYSLCTPLLGATRDDPNPDVSGVHPDYPVDPIVWLTPTYDESYMLGNQTNPLTIDSRTGFISGFPEIQGTFVIGVCVSEYRNGELLTTIRRDIQINTISCEGIPTADFSPSGTYCEGVEVDFVNNSQNASFFKWFFDLEGDISQTSNEENPTYVYPDTGTYRVMLIATEDSVCIDTLIQELNVQFTGLVPDFDFAVNECTDTFELELTDLSTDSVSTIIERTWTLEFADTTIELNGTNLIYETTRSGTVTVTLDILAANGCTASISREFELTFINLDLLGDSLSICLGESTFLLNTGFDPDLMYTWTPDNNLDPSNIVPNPEASPRNTTTYRVSATDGLCVVNDSVFVEVRGEDLEVIDITEDRCDSFRTVTITGVPYDSLIWSENNLFDPVLSREDTFTVRVENELTLFVRIYSSELNCVLESSINLENQGVQISYPDTLMLCTGDTVSYTLVNLDPEDTLNISWEPNDLILGPLDGATIRLFTETLEDGVLVFTVTNEIGCTHTDSIYVMTIESLEADFTFERECGSLTVSFNNLNDRGMWQWDFGDGNTSTEMNPTHTYDAPGMYTVTLASLDACMTMSSQTINVNLIELDLQDTIVVCTNQPVPLNPGGNPNYTYVWTPAGPLDDPSSANPIATVDQTTVFTVVVSEDSDTCTLTRQVVVEVEELFDLSADDTEICAMDTVRITANPFDPNRVITWSWEPTNVIVGDPTSNEVTAVLDSTTTFTVTATTPEGCEEVKTITITVEMLDPSVVATADPPSIMYGDKTQLDVEGGDPNWMYTWSPGESLDDSTLINPMAMPRDTTKFVVIIKTDNGCEFMRMVTVNVEQPPCRPPYVFLPNAFSPNGDGVNDVLALRGDFIESMELIIYDRWGQKVFETTDPTAAWDGLTRGTENQPGAYGYILRVVCEGGGMHQEQGSITLMR